MPGRRGDDAPARSARTSARGRRAGRCIRPAASARGAAPARPRRRRRRSRSDGGAGSGRRRAGRCRAAGRPTTAAARRARSAAPAQARRSRPASSTAWPGSASAAATPPGGVVGARERRLHRVALGAPAPRLSPAPPAWPRRPRGASAPGRSWCRRSAAPCGTNCSARPIVSAISSGVSIASEATSITPTITSLPSSRRISSGGTCEWKHSSDTWSIALFASAGKTCSYWRHSLAERRLPVDVGLDAVAVADVHRGLARQPLGGALERGHAPLGGLGHVDVERRLVELDDVDAVGLERARFLVEQLGEGERHLDAACLALAVVAVGDGVDDRHRPGQGELELPVGVGAGEARLGRVDPAAAGAAGRPPAAPSRRSGCRGSPSSPCARSRCLRPGRGSRARSAGATARRRRRRRGPRPPAPSARAAWHRPWRARARRRSAFHSGHSFSVSASHEGLGRLPAMAVSKHRSDPRCRVRADRLGAPRLLPSARECRQPNPRPKAEAPLPAAERIAALDVLRGVALLGIFIMNMPGFSHSLFTPPRARPRARSTRWVAVAARAAVRRQVQPDVRPAVRHRLPSPARPRCERARRLGAGGARRSSMRAGSRCCWRSASSTRRCSGRATCSLVYAVLGFGLLGDPPLAGPRGARADRPLPRLPGGRRRVCGRCCCRSRPRPSRPSSTRTSRSRTPPPSAAARSSTRCARRRGSSPGATPRRSACSATPRSTCRWRPASCSASSSAGARWVERLPALREPMRRGAARRPRRGLLAGACCPGRRLRRHRARRRRLRRLAGAHASAGPR